jgi:adenosylhomocysteine nucleosidase
VSTVVLLTALDLEYQAVRRRLDGLRVRSHPAGTLFEVGYLPGVAGTIALAVTGEGNVGAAVLAERAIAMFQPRALLCVGVAGGLKSDIALGDVVVATKVYALHGGRVRGDGFLARPKAWPASHELEQLARHVARTGTWAGLLPPDSGRWPPMVHFKPIASGEVVLNSPQAPLAGRLRDVYDDAVAVEMESAGVAQAAHLNRSLPVLSVRGISDRADTGKDLDDAAGWQHAAAGHAAAFTVAMLALALSGRAAEQRSAARPPLAQPPHPAHAGATSRPAPAEAANRRRA